MSKYEQIMDRITVSASAKERILNQVTEELPDVPDPQSGKIAHLEQVARPAGRSRFRRFAAVAACLTVLFIGSISAYHLSGWRTGFETAGMSEGIMEEDGVADEKILAEDTTEVTECVSAAELSRIVGFEIRDIQPLKKESEETGYYAYGQDLAEIVYTTDKGELYYRRSMSSDVSLPYNNLNQDISGHYNEYSQEEKVRIDEITLTLQGEDDLYYLGIWQNDGYSNSLYMQEGISIEEWVKLLEPRRCIP